jgi:cell division protein FtsB
VSRVATLPPQSKSRWLKLRYLAVFAVCGWALYHYWHVQQPQLATLNAKQNTLTQQMAAMEKQRDELTKQAQQLQNKDYIARYASQHYNLILPGQVSFDVKQ